MKVLAADDDDISLLKLEALLSKRGYTPIPATDGEAAWQILQADDPPPLAVLDWMMPGVDGLELCRRVRESPRLRGLYVILLTGRGEREDVLAGLRAGANDYVTKPFDPEELQARLHVAAQVMGLQAELAARVKELEDALAQVKQLQGLLPICSYCKKIRDDQDYWHQVEHYVAQHSDAKFSHGICPECWDRVIKPELARARIKPSTGPSEQAG